MYKYGISLGGDKEVVLDCIQDLFIEVWQKRNKLGEVTKIKNYFFVSFRRKLLRMLKREKKSLSIFSSSHFEVLINKSIEEEVMDERIHGLPSVLRKLSKSKLEAINLRFFHGYTCEDIAIIMGINKQSVYNKISSALKVLKHHLTK